MRVWVRHLSRGWLPSWECTTSQEGRTSFLAHAQININTCLLQSNQPIGSILCLPHSLLRVLFVSNMSPHVSLIFAFADFFDFILTFLGFLSKNDF
jgi:hypothetical protein